MSLQEKLARALSAYSIERELGGGGMSRVFLAEEKTLKRQVVIKVLPPELSGGINLERFQREIQLAATLQHPHIVPVFSSGDVDGTPYFTMPFVEGESLRGRLQRGGLPVAEAVSVMRDVCKALMYAHQHGVVHRDIKPDNVLLSSGAATVMDFGVAKALTASTSPGELLTATGVALGTPAYMAPEQASADPNVDARADIYALGVLAYEMLVGNPPFAGRSAQQQLAAHMTETPRPVVEARSSVPHALSALVMRCLDKRPEDRPQSAADVLRELETIGTPNSGTTLTVAASPPARRRRGTLVLAGGIAALAVIGAVVARYARGGGNADSSAPPPVTQSGVSVARYRPTSLVVAPFANMTGDSAMDVVGAVAAHSMTDGLAQLDSLTVAPVSSGLTDTSGHLQHFGTAEAVRALGRSTRSQAVVWGSYFKTGKDSISMSAQLVDVSDGRVRVTLQPVTVRAGDATSAIEKLRDQMMSAVDAAALTGRLGSIGKPPTVAAYREFLLGLDARWNAVTDFNRLSIPHFDAATRLDTTFTIAYYYAIMMRSNIAGGVTATTNAAVDTMMKYFRAADSVFAIIAPRRSRLSGVDADLYDEAKAIARSDFEGKFNAISKQLARDSAERLVGNLASTALNLNRPSTVLSLLHNWPESRRTMSAAGFGTLEARAYHSLGQFQKAVDAAVRERKKYPARTGAFTNELLARAAMGDSAGLARQLDSLRTGWAPGDPILPLNAFLNATRELYAHGHEALSRVFATQGLAWYATRSDTARRTYAATAALLYQGSGQGDSAMAAASRLAANSNTRALIEALHGKPALALSALAEVDTLPDEPYLRGRGEFYKARLLAALGRKEEAVVMLKKAMTRGVPFDYSVDWHTDPPFFALRDYAPFQALLKPKS